MDAFDREMVELQMLIATMGRQLVIITALIQGCEEDNREQKDHKECVDTGFALGSPKLKDNSRATTQG